MLCKQCGKEFEASRSDAKFCSPICKLRFNRDTDKVDTDKSDTDKQVDDTDKVITSDTDKSITKEKQTDKEYTNPVTGFKERTYTLEELCTAEELRNTPNMCETRKLHHEAIYRLEHNDIEKLRKAGVWIPSHYGK